MFKLTSLVLDQLNLAKGVIIVACLSATFSVIAKDQKYNIGSAASDEQIIGWDIDVRPDGLGLPPGTGSVLDGEIIYEEQCASCHGVFGEGEGTWPVLAGGEGTLRESRPEKTIGSYWPHLSTLWDYIHRAMPFLNPQTLKDDEVYALTAYILYLNELVEEDFVLNHENFTSIKLLNEASFVDDPRPDVHNKRCMTKCKDPKSIELSWQPSSLAAAEIDQQGAPDTAMQGLKISEGETTYTNACAICHDSGLAGAPAINDSAAWKDRIKQGVAILHEHAINGYHGDTGFMPAKGGNTTLSDAAVKLAVEHIINQQ